MVNAGYSPDHLLVVHYHLRPGGVRKVIETALPTIVAACPSLRQVTLICGGEAAPDWVAALKGRMNGTPLRVIHDAAFGYFSESPGEPDTMRTHQRTILLSAVAGSGEVLVWAHNLGLARNLPLASELAALAARPKFRLISHHHDFWFDNRWHRQADFAASGYPTLEKVGRDLLSGGSCVAFATVNRTDRDLLKPFHSAVRWLPNPVQNEPEPSLSRIDAVRQWMTERLEDDSPFWLFPTRFLRRKNLAEAILITQWIHPGAWLVTTGGPSSESERRAFGIMQSAIEANRWRCRLSVIEQEMPGSPTPSELLSAATGVIVTSVREGFGLTYFEAASANKPLVARRIPDLADDLLHLGLQVAQGYSEILICPSLLNVERERERQRKRWCRWRDGLPAALQQKAGGSWTWKSDGPLAFGKLTLEAQLEVLSHDAEKIRQSSGRWNSMLEDWRRSISAGTLSHAILDPSKQSNLSVDSYAKAFWELADSCLVFPNARASDAHRHGMAASVCADDQYPMLWESDPSSH